MSRICDCSVVVVGESDEALNQALAGLSDYRRQTGGTLDLDAEKTSCDEHRNFGEERADTVFTFRVFRENRP
jgi:hypothetical protein